MKNIDLPLRSAAVSDDPDLRFEVEAPTTTDATDSSISYGLNMRSNNNGDDGGSVERDRDQSQLPLPRSIENVILAKFKEDMENLPEDRGMAEFEDVPVEGFGAALLKAYGWEEGRGIGKNATEDVKVVQYTRRGDKEGLGFVPSVENVDKKGRVKEVMVAAKGVDGRNRHVVGVDEKLVKRELKGVHVGKVVRIVSGRHVGVKGKVLEKNDEEVVLKLGNGEKVMVGIGEVAELGSVDDEMCVEELRSKSRSSRDDRRKTERRDREKESEKKDYRRSGERASVKDIKYDNGSEHRSKGKIREKERPLPPVVSWLTSHIRVRIISKDFKGGKLYLKKGEVVDVVGPNVCDISLDESNQLIQGVDQEILETVVPKRGGPVLVLYGKHKGVYGHLMERNSEKETGIVRDADNHALLHMPLEQIAEYIGDPTSLGY